MKHLDDEELVELYYGEAGAEAAAHAAGCAECGSRAAALKEELSMLQPGEPPERDSAYGARVWAAIRQSLPVYEQPPRRRAGWLAALWSRRGPVYAAVCLAIAATAFATGRIWEHKSWQSRRAAKQHEQTKEHVIVVVLADHLDRSERLLVELKHADAASDAELLPAMRAQARSLLAANKVARDEAAKANDPTLNVALGRLDHLLVELAESPGDLDAGKLRQLQAEMQAEGLLFDVRVLRARIPAENENRQDSKRGAI